MAHIGLPNVVRTAAVGRITPIRVPLTDIFLTVGMPRIVTSGSVGYQWFPDIVSMSTGQLLVTYSRNPDSNNNVTNTQAVYLSADQIGDFRFGYDIGGFHTSGGQPLVKLSDGTVVGGTYVITPVPNNGTATANAICDRITYANGGQTYTVEHNAMSITFPETVAPLAGSPSSFMWAFWYGRIIDLGGNVWITNIQWIANTGTYFKDGCFKSMDLGYTWTYVGEIGAPSDVPLSTEGFSEPAICRLQNGNLFCTSRTGNAPNVMYSASSADNGVTWTTPVPSTHPGTVAPSLITLTNGITVELAGHGMIFRFTKNNTTTWRSWDALAYHNDRMAEDGRINNISQANGQSTGYYGIQEISANRVGVVYDYLPGGRAGQPGTGIAEAQIYILEFDVSL